jgi:hypothetical protein
LTLSDLNGQLTGLAANAASLAYFREQGVAEFDPLHHGLTGGQAYFLDVPGTDSVAALPVVSFKATEKKGMESIRIPLPALPVALDQRLFSNRVDLSDAGFATSNTDHAWADVAYLVTDKAGNNLTSGTLDEAATGSRFFSQEQKNVDVWVGNPGWEPAEGTLPDDDSEEENA